MRALIIRTLLCVAVMFAAAGPSYSQTIYRGPYGDYPAYYPGYYPRAYSYPRSSYYPGPYNRQYLSTTSPYFGTRGYYDSIPYGSSWYSGYYDAPVYRGGHSYNYEPSYRN